MKDRLIATAVALYLLVALGTFGAAWHMDYEAPRPNAIVGAGELNGTRSFLMAALWPFYWSVKITGRVFFGTPMKRDA